MAPSVHEHVNAQGWVCLQETSVYLSPNYTSTAVAGGRILVKKPISNTRWAQARPARTRQALQDLRVASAEAQAMRVQLPGASDRSPEQRFAKCMLGPVTGRKTSSLSLGQHFLNERKLNTVGP